MAVPGVPLSPWLAVLPPDPHGRLAHRLGAGVHYARHASECPTAAGTSQHETPLQLVAYLRSAVQELNAARALIVAQLDAS